MLKLGSSAAHLHDPKEKELNLKDIPKDKDELERKMDSQAWWFDYFGYASKAYLLIKF